MTKRHLLRRLLFSLLIFVVFAAAVAWLTLRASLPQLNGKLAAPAVSAPVTIQRDALGVATIHGANRRDVFYALGFVHAQERFFEMDLMRRLAAGELAELVGAAALPLDRQHRPFRMRARVEQTVAAMSADDRADLAAYRDGANAGVAGLSSRPWEYWLLGSTPQPWRDADSLLVAATCWSRRRCSSISTTPRMRASWLFRASMRCSARRPTNCSRFPAGRGMRRCLARR
jgi:penicillin amidase